MTLSPPCTGSAAYLKARKLTEHTNQGGLRWFLGSSLAGRDVPEFQWHVPGLIPTKNVTMLGGPGGTGKSLIALQLAVATAAGRRWLGRDCAAGAAVYLSAEDDAEEIHRRLDRIVKAEGIDLLDLDQLTVLPLAGEDALLLTPDPRTGVLHRTQLFRDLEALLADHPQTLVVFDTLADLHSGNENDRTIARQFIGALRGLAMHRDCAAVLLSHPSLTGKATGTGLSGSTAWDASVRSRLYLDTADQNDHRRLTVKKANYAPSDQEIELAWREGVFVAVDSSEAAPSRPRLTGKEKIALEAFSTAIRDFGERRTGPDWPDVPVVAESHWRDACFLHGLFEEPGSSTARSAFKRVKDALHEKGITRFFSGMWWRTYGE